MLTQSGQPPTILQQLCALPFQYFSNPRLTNILFPTLISCCYDNQLNREILEQELSCSLLSNFIEVSAKTCCRHGYISCTQLCGPYRPGKQKVKVNIAIPPVIRHVSHIVCHSQIMLVFQNKLFVVVCFGVTVSRLLLCWFI